MKERPILFSAPMVRAILDGRKTQTRRAVKNVPANATGVMIAADGSGDIKFTESAGGFNLAVSGWIKRPYGKPGDRLWVRETINARYEGDGAWMFTFAADGSGVDLRRQQPECGDKYLPTKMSRPVIPSIHMPRWASRITLEITNVRVERLQEITNSDAQQEGMPYATPHRHGVEGLLQEYTPDEFIKDEYAHKHNTGINDCWICAFRMLWQSINGRTDGCSWDANPWVWVIEFKRVEP